MKKILHFTANWCMPCKRLKPVIDEFIAKNPEVEYQAIDVDVDFNLAKAYQVQSVPTLIILSDDDIFSRHTGIGNYQKIESLVFGDK